MVRQVANPIRSRQKWGLDRLAGIEELRKSVHPHAIPGHSAVCVSPLLPRRRSAEPFCEAVAGGHCTRLEQHARETSAVGKNRERMAHGRFTDTGSFREVRI